MTTKFHPESALLARGWLQLGLVALLLSNVLALVLVAARLPGISRLIAAPDALFGTALVLHVDLAIYVWVLSAAAMLCHLWLPAPPSRWHGGCFLAAVVATLAMVITPWLDSSRALLNNYLPVLESPLFLSSAGVFLAAWLGGLGAVLRFKGAQLSAPPWRRLLLGVLWLLVLVSLVIWVRGVLQTEALGLTAHRLELALWGGGHMMQAFNVGLLVCCLVVIAGEREPRSAAARIAAGILCLNLIAGLFLAFSYAPDQSAYREGFTGLMRYLSWLAFPATALFLVSRWRQGYIRQAPQGLALLLALAIFVLGLIAGALIRADNLLVPAHYHAMTGALNLGLMGAIYHFQRPLGLRLPESAWLKRQLWLYGCGLVLLVAGLGWGGAAGHARKEVAAHSAGLDLQVLPMLLLGAGAAVALAGSFLFIGIIFRSLRKKPGLAAATYTMPLVPAREVVESHACKSSQG
ncbi:hypothetical protein [Motiliproteus sp. SC1-56]|uniref:hypothetical protein n=1 Tax=Motiliproteus sp. SC1-56 TaxID=2799565 RepID=UPI001A8C534E|nr:hypothetical protein [Motiliproteus sp. SC1-56]